jgi:hypothetical protein
MARQSARPTAKSLVPNNTLITRTPEEGRQLAMRLAHLTVEVIQPDEVRRQVLRDVYANDPAMLIAVSGVVAREFATIAHANNYWRE